MRRGLVIALVVLACGVGEARAEPVYEPGPLPHCYDIKDGTGLVIGDSHTYMGGCGDQYPGMDADALVGRDTGMGVAFLDYWLRGRHQFVLYDLATNDVTIPGQTRTNLRDAYEIAQRGHPRTMFLVTTRRLDLSTDQVNQALRDFADNHSLARVIPWAGEVSDSEFGPDGVHFTAAGYAHRTAFICARIAARDFSC